MKITTYEGVIENGQIKFSEEVDLPEHAKVYVVVTGVADNPNPRLKIQMSSPRLARPDDAAFFTKEVSEEPPAVVGGAVN